MRLPLHLVSLPPLARRPAGDIEELNLSNEKVRLVTAEDTAPEGEAHAAKRARGAGGKDDGAHGHGAMGKPGSEAAAGANGDSVSPNGGERFVVRFVNPHAGARPDGGDADAPAGKPHGHGAGGGHAPGGDKRAQERSAGGRDRAGGGHAPPRSHKAGANQLGLDSVLVPRSDRGVAADGARALVAFGDGGMWLSVRQAPAPAPVGCAGGRLVEQLWGNPFPVPSPLTPLPRPAPPGPAFSAQPYSQADAAAVRQWLAARGMVKYAPLFEANEVRASGPHPALRGGEISAPDRGAAPHALECHPGLTRARCAGRAARGHGSGAERAQAGAPSTCPGRAHSAIRCLILTPACPWAPHAQVDMATLPYLTLQDLRDLPIHAVGPRRKLLAALERM